MLIFALAVGITWSLQIRYIEGECVSMGKACTGRGDTCLSFVAVDGTIRIDAALEGSNPVPDAFPARCWSNGVDTIMTLNPTTTLIATGVVFGVIFLIAIICGVCDTLAGGRGDLGSPESKLLYYTVCFLGVPLFFATVILSIDIGSVRDGTCVRYVAIQNQGLAFRFQETAARGGGIKDYSIERSSYRPTTFPHPCWVQGDDVTATNPYMVIGIAGGGLGGVVVLALLGWLYLEYRHTCSYRWACSNVCKRLCSCSCSCKRASQVAPTELKEIVTTQPKG
ncbi:Hypothetical protein POVN_LOCUS712 [uncultured virus]|nr:Hypothetical protein POVN_LOCUS712 [uncultured virus]